MVNRMLLGLALAATVLMAGCASGRSAEAPTPPKFDSQAWKGASGSAGHPAEIAKRLVERGTLISMTTKEVGELLGDFDGTGGLTALRSAGDTRPVDPDLSGGALYVLDDGTVLRLGIEGNRVVTATISPAPTR